MKKCVLMVLVLGLITSAATATLTYTQNFDGAGLLVGNCGWKNGGIAAGGPAYSLKGLEGEGGTTAFRLNINTYEPTVETTGTFGTEVLLGNVVTNFGGTGIKVSYWVQSMNNATDRLYLQFKSGTTTWSKEVFAAGSDMKIAKNVSVDMLYADSTGWVRKTGAGTATFSDSLSNVTAWNLWATNTGVVPGYYLNPKVTAADQRVDSISFTTIPEPATLALLAIGGILSLRKKR